MIFAMSPLSKNNIREIEEIFDRKIEPFFKFIQLEFLRIDQRFLKIDQRFDQAFQKLDDFMSMYKNHDEQILMLTSQSRQLSDKVDDLNGRVTRLES